MASVLIFIKAKQRWPANVKTKACVSILTDVCYESVSIMASGAGAYGLRTAPIASRVCRLLPVLAVHLSSDWVLVCACTRGY